MKLMYAMSAAALAICLTGAAAAQTDAPPQKPYPTAPAQQPAPAPAELRPWIPDGLNALGQYANGRTEFTLDHSMLVLASKLDRDNQELRRVLAGVNAVSVHSYHFAGGVLLDPAEMNELARQHQEAGFLHLVSKHPGEGGRVTDLWLRMEGETIRDIAVLWVMPHDVNFVSVSGSITPLDLLRLSGHMGIPRMDSGVAVPVPGQANAGAVAPVR
jgi:hypothetical protein